MDVGNFFMIGFQGHEPSREIKKLIKKKKLGGVILFKRNIESSEQLKALTSDLKDIAGGDLLIGIDQEGGRVSNLPLSIIDAPPMEKLGRDYERGVSERHAHLLGHELGEKLKSLGINIDFAPVLDVRTNPDNPIIGSRSFSEVPEIVSRLGYEVVRGIRQSGILSCGKHFPGHGDTNEDSHESLPLLSIDRKRMDEIELIPFKEVIAKDIPSLMSAHVIYKGIDPDFPATLSKKILSDLLRIELQFKGVLFSDDLEMKAIADNYAIPEASVMAINAGCDILLICHDIERQQSAIDRVTRAIDDGEISEERFTMALQRIQNLKSYIK